MGVPPMLIGECFRQHLALRVFRFCSDLPLANSHAWPSPPCHDASSLQIQVRFPLVNRLLLFPRRLILPLLARLPPLLAILLRLHALRQCARHHDPAKWIDLAHDACPETPSIISAVPYRAYQSQEKSDNGRRPNSFDSLVPRILAPVTSPDQQLTALDITALDRLFHSSRIDCS